MRILKPLGTVIVAALVSTTAMAQRAPEKLDRLVRSSSLVFLGTVEKLGAATTDEVTPQKNTAVVLVNEVYTPTRGLGNLAQRRITVQLKPEPPLEVGASAVFFADGVMYGRSVVVREVARMKVTDREAVRKEIEEALARQADSKLMRRIARSQLVVAGKVAGVHPIRGHHRAWGSEHEPDWRAAVIDIRTTVRGQYDGRQVTVVFPASGDEMWAPSPKFKEGQEGIWILQRDQQEKGPPKMRVPGYTALDPLDFQPPYRLELVRRLARSAR